MKTSSQRYARRRSRSTSRDGNFFQKDNTGEQGFFGDPARESFFQQTPAALQRKCAECEEEKSLKRKSQAKEEEEKKLQRKAEVKKEEEEKLQKKSEPEKEEEKEKKVMKKEAGVQSPSAVKTPSYLNTLSNKGSTLPNSALQFFGRKMGCDFSQVRIHTGAEAEASAKEVNAKAYTYRNHVVFNQGEYNPATPEGKKLLAHELVHTVQQEGTSTAKPGRDSFGPGNAEKQGL